MHFHKVFTVFLLCFFAFGFIKLPFIKEKKPEVSIESVKKLIGKKSYKKALDDFKTITPNAHDNDYRFLNFFLLTVNEQYEDIAKLSTKGMEDYILADYLFLYVASALNETKQYEQSMELLKQQENAFDRSRLRHKIDSQRIRAAIELKKFYEANTYLNSWSRRKLDIDERVEKLFLEGRVFEASGRLQDATTNYKQIYVNYPLASSASEAKERLKALKSLDLTTHEIITRTKGILSNGHIFDAKQELNTLRKVYFKTNNREFLYYISKLYLKTGKKAKAKQNFELFAKYAEEERKRNSHLDTLLPEVKYELLLREWNEGHNDHGIAIRKWLVKHYPTSKWTAKATWILGKMSENKNDFPAAIQYYEEFLRFDSTDDETYWRLGWVYYLSGDYGKSAENFLLSRKYVRDAYLEQQILFWLGMAFLKDQKKEQAEKAFSSLLGKYKNTYYGFLAMAKAEQNGLALAYKPYRTKPLNLDGTPKLNQQQKDLVEKIQKLNSLGLHNLAAKEVLYLDESTSNGKVSLLYISNLYKESKAYYQSHNVLLRALVLRGIYNYDNLPKEFLQTLLPRHYFNLIETSGERHKVSPYFVLSLIKQESSFNPEALSSAGAVGLMQLMPKTAKQTFQKKKLYKVLPKDAFRDLEAPENNIEIGIAHINVLAEKMDDSPVEVIASYNAGKKAVASWLKRFDKSDLPVFIERITYPETRNYVKKVATNTFNYEAIYGKQPFEDGVFGSPKTFFEK